MPSRWTLAFVLLFTVGPYAACTAPTLLAQGPSMDDIEKAMSTKLPSDPASVVAVVGESKILYSDVKSQVDARIKMVLEKTPQKVPEDQLHFARINLTRGLLIQAIQNKGMRELFLLNQVGTQAADKRREASGIMSSRARQMFYESEVPDLKKKYKVNDLASLNDALQKEGSSVAGRERNFMDAMLAHMYMRSAVEKDPTITLAEINDYYLTNRKDYAHKSKARWEQLTVLFENHTDDEAQKLIADIGREAFYGGNIQAVAKQRSEEPFASQGGLHDWTNRGSLASKALDQQIFSIPLNRMSTIIRDDTGLHIIRVLERKPAGIASLGSVQEEIREQLKKEKVAASQKEAMAAMRKRVPVWTIFPDDIPGSKQLNVPRVAGLPDAQNY